MRVIGIRILVVLTLSVGTILLFNVVDRYQFSGRELLVNNNFHQKLEGWEEVGAGVVVIGDGQPVVRLTSEDDHESVAIKQVLGSLGKDQLVRFSGEMKTEGVEPAGKEWQGARLMLVGLNDDGTPMYEVPHVLTARHGTADWEYFSKVFAPNDGVAELQVVVQLLKVKGSVWVKGLSLRPVSERPIYKAYWVVDVVVWIAVMFWVLAPYRHVAISSIWHMLIIIMLAGILVGVLMPPDFKNSVGSMLRSSFPWISDAGALFRVGHFLSFASLSLVVFWKARSRRDVFEKLGLLVLFAMVTEVLQLLVDGRNSQVWDFFSDAAGVGAALIISGVWLNMTGSWSARV